MWRDVTYCIVCCVCVVINCSLKRIGGLECVGSTLLHLSLSDQELTHIEGLDALVHLRSLCLQQNQIARIEGLDQYVRSRTAALDRHSSAYRGGTHELLWT